MRGASSVSDAGMGFSTNFMEADYLLNTR